MNNITGLTHLILMNNINRNLRKSEKSESKEANHFTVFIILGFVFLIVAMFWDFAK